MKIPKAKMKSLSDALGLPPSGGAVSIVGGGGKTTLMFTLARELSALGKKVLTTTTTKIFHPAKNQSEHVLYGIATDRLPDAFSDILRSSRHLTAAKGYLPEAGKLTGFSSDEIGRIFETDLFDWILIEADGAAGRPLKAPAEYEPVIAECSDRFVGVVGLDVLGKPLDEKWVFRPEIFSDITGLPLESSVTADVAASASTHPLGLAKGIRPHMHASLFFNKSDLIEMKTAVRDMRSALARIQSNPFGRIVFGSLRNGGPYEYFDRE